MYLSLMAFFYQHNIASEADHIANKNSRDFFATKFDNELIIFSYNA